MFFQTSVLEAAELTSRELSKKNNVPWDRYLVWKIPAQIVKIWQSNIGLEKKKKKRYYSQMYLEVLVVSVPAYLSSW